MVTRRRFLALLGVTSAAAGAAAAGFTLLPGDDKDAGSGPPAIRFGEDSCATCGMVIADARFAAAWRDASGTAARFDDTGCMVKLLREQDPGATATFYVRDYSDESWVDAPAAAYVVSDEVKSPMAYGIAAFASNEAAGTLATTYNTEVLTWDTVRSTVGKEGSM